MKDVAGVVNNGKEDKNKEMCDADKHTGYEKLGNEKTLRKRTVKVKFHINDNHLLEVGI